MSQQHSPKKRRFEAIHRLEAVKISVRDPCSIPWETMQEIGRSVRHCSLCQLNVYDFAERSPDEIVALLNQHEGKLCAQFYARSDGTMTVEPCDDRSGTLKMTLGVLILSPEDDNL